MKNNKKDSGNNNNNNNNNKYIITAIVCIVVICALMFVMIKRSALNDDRKDVTIIEEPRTTEPTSETETIELSPDPVTLDDSLYEAVGDFNEQLKSYCENNAPEGGFISAYGFLCRDTGTQPVGVSDIDEGADERLQNADILYIRPSDFEVCENLEELDVDSLDDELKPFTAVLTDKGYLVSSAEYGGGLVSEKDYRSLIMRYNCAHGEIRSPERDSALFEKIYTLISQNWGAEGTVDIKYMGVDDKYGIVVANLVENPLEFREFLIMKAGNDWAVRSKELAKQDNVKAYVNNKYPDMELALLPYYTLSDYDDFKTDLFGYYDQIVELKDLGVTEADLPAVYCLYSDNFIYYEFANEKRIVGHLDDDVLSFYKVNSTDEAVALMSKFTDKPPVFIIKFS